MLPVHRKNFTAHIPELAYKDTKQTEQQRLLVDKSEPEGVTENYIDPEELVSVSHDQRPHHFFGLQRSIGEIEAQLAKVPRTELGAFEANFRQLESDARTHRSRIVEDWERCEARTKKAESIRRNFAQGKADAVKTNLLLHSGARNLRIIGDAEFEDSIAQRLHRHGDEYFITEAGEGEDRTYHLRYVTLDHQVQTIEFAPVKQAEFDIRISEIMDIEPPEELEGEELVDEYIALTHED